MVGIYQITSPSGKVYIGQSWNIQSRFRYYRSAACDEQPGIYRSLIKYGFGAHKAEVVYELPSDVSQAILDEYEIFFIEQIKASGTKMLNMKGGGSYGKHLPESIAKIKAVRKNQAPPTKGFKFSAESCLKRSISLTGKKRTEEQKLKFKGRKVSDATRKLMSENRKGKSIFWIGRKHNEDSKRRMSASAMGNKRNNKKVLCTKTGRLFESLTDAAETVGLTMKNLSNKMRGKGKNWTGFIYV